MSEAEESLRTILKNNVGFENDSSWIEYARGHGFKPVKAVKVTRCPDCSGVPDRRRRWGQYIYYSTLIHLLECADCGLVWADAQIDPDTVRAHFEFTYKDDSYYAVARRPIFEHLAGVIDQLAPTGGKVLDIGGARGDLMATVLARRPDLRIVVNDISEAATKWANTKYGLETITGGADALAQHEAEYDVVVLSDVLYYEPRLGVLWDAIGRLVAFNGSIVIRLPNKHPLIRLGQLWYKLTHSTSERLMQDSIRFFNPEHIFVFRPRYLRRRLARMGFGAFRILPSPLLRNKGTLGLASRLFDFATVVNRFLLHRLVLTPGMLVIARKERHRI